MMKVVLLLFISSVFFQRLYNTAVQVVSYSCTIHNESTLYCLYHTSRYTQHAVSRAVRVRQNTLVDGMTDKTAVVYKDKQSCRLAESGIACTLTKQLVWTHSEPFGSALLVAFCSLLLAIAARCASHKTLLLILNTVNRSIILIVMLCYPRCW